MAVLPLTLLPSAPAQAASMSRLVKSNAVEVLSVEPMYIGGFDASVAEAHGFTIRTRADGVQYVVRKGAAPNATPLNVVYGNCGYSFVYGYPSVGSRAIELYTGWHVTNWGVSYHWEVRLNDQGGTSFQTWYGLLNFDENWTADRVVGGLTAGPGQATVVPAVSFVEFWDGGVCYAGSPPATSTYWIPS